MTWTMEDVEILWEYIPEDCPRCMDRNFGKLDLGRSILKTEDADGLTMVGWFKCRNRGCAYTVVRRFRLTENPDEVTEAEEQ